ncbi:MSEP-CTERM sorting domain-containing protein [Hymenobacter ruricola]|uniref:MSEP-CTERM sorting domain-containing protein n=1 Tax=Hymenobacter ruricola TaxID=2791023 RepID=A0ABS0I3U9_9BACT|nr:MSEP-CTERM sorting domain-containing protein [Hymenobacter ruricola]MBF9221398.1 MSEP-CTERM sorting domain-containing protein [Hymenobacter ruricola]
MPSLRSPQWIFLVNTAPVAAALLLCYGEYSVVHTLLPPVSVALWQKFGLAALLLGVGMAGYAGRQWVRQRPVGGWFCAVAALATSVLLCLLTWHGDGLLPFGVVPRWMVPTEPLLIGWTFLMPTLVHALLALVAKFTPDDRPQSALPNIAFAVLTPLGWIVAYQILSEIGHLAGSSGAYDGPSRWETLTTVLFVGTAVLSTLSFFFFLVRALFIMTGRREGFWVDTSLVWKLVITVGLPLLGLAVNNGLLFGHNSLLGEGLFGDFSSPWFYALAMLNGALLCLPDSSRPPLRLAQLLGRSALFGYTFYFFIVFLPFLPLSIPAIILIGTGFLLLAPTLLFVVHVRQLGADLAALRGIYSQKVVVGTLAAGLAALPVAVTADYWHDRRVLHAALAQVYTPDYARPMRIDAAGLAGTLAVIRQNQNQYRHSLLGTHLPYLSSYFNWLVLDNLMLSEDKLSNLERIFVGSRRPIRETWAETPGRPAELRDVHAESRYDARQQAWVSWVKLDVGNSELAGWNAEYRTTIQLPPGCWVSDYYLTIGQRQERGILAEKRAADWVFAQIVSENRDPGLLTYSGPNAIDLRVFPVTTTELRHTGIQLLHKEPCTLIIDGRTVALGDSTDVGPLVAPVATAGNGVVYLSALAKQALPLVQRRPYYHFLLDASAQSAGQQQALQQRVQAQLAQPLPHGGPARFSLVNAYTTPVPAGTDWAAQLNQARWEGGFYLGGAIRQVLFEAQEHPAPTYPVLVAVTDQIENAVLDADFADFSSAYPESDAFYVLGPDGQLVPHSLRRQSRQVMGAAPAAGVPVAVRAWPSAARPRAYLPDTNAAEVVLGQPQAVPTPTAAPNNPWLTGLLLRGYSQWQTFHPETTERERVPFIQASFRAGILTPFTSFLALENEAQKAALRRKQNETMNANAALDTQEKGDLRPTETPLDGGAALLLGAGVLLAVWQLRRLKTANAL